MLLHLVLNLACPRPGTFVLNMFRQLDVDLNIRRSRLVHESILESVLLSALGGDTPLMAWASFLLLPLLRAEAQSLLQVEGQLRRPSETSCKSMHEHAAFPLDPRPSGHSRPQPALTMRRGFMPWRRSSRRRQEVQEQPRFVEASSKYSLTLLL